MFLYNDVLILPFMRTHGCVNDGIPAQPLQEESEHIAPPRRWWAHDNQRITRMTLLLLWWNAVRDGLVLGRPWPGESDWLFIFRLISHFIFLWIEFQVIFVYLIKYYHNMFIIIVFLLASDRPSGIVYFVPILLLSILTPLFLPSSVSLFYFILAVPMCECLGKHSSVSSHFL